MTIQIRYDSSFQTIEVSEAECEPMIRADYEERLLMAADPSTVQPRTMQEIMDERFNKPEYNNYHKYRRHTCSLEAFDFEGEVFVDPTANPADAVEWKETVCALFAAIRTLQPQQQELIRRRYYNCERVTDIAREDGVSPNAVSNRLQKIHNALKKELQYF